MKILASHKTGSNYICDPPVTDTDVDVIFLVDEVPSISKMFSEGWTFNCGKDEYPATMQFYSFKKELDGVMYNLLVTPDVAYYKQFVLATELAKKMNLHKKEDRVMLFTAMLMPICHLPEKLKKYLPYEDISNS